MEEKLKNGTNIESGEKIFEPLAQKYKLTFKELGGLEELKKQANMKIIQPFKNPELFRKFKKAAGGGILLYGAQDVGKATLPEVLQENVMLLFTMLE